MDESGNACASNECSKSKCCCPCHKVMSILVILFGLTFLLGALDILSADTVQLVWPFIIILAGLKSMCAGGCKCCSKG